MREIKKHFGFSVLKNALHVDWCYESVICVGAQCGKTLSFVTHPVPKFSGSLILKNSLDPFLKRSYREWGKTPCKNEGAPTFEKETVFAMCTFPWTKNTLLQNHVSNALHSPHVRLFHSTSSRSRAAPSFGLKVTIRFGISERKGGSVGVRG